MVKLQEVYSNCRLAIKLPPLAILSVLTFDLPLEFTSALVR